MHKLKARAMNCASHCGIHCETKAKHSILVSPLFTTIMIEVHHNQRPCGANAFAFVLYELCTCMLHCKQYCVCVQLPQMCCTTKPTHAQSDWESDCCILMCKGTEWPCNSNHTCAATSNQHMHSVHGNQNVESYAIQTLKCSAQPDTPMHSLSWNQTAAISCVKTAQWPCKSHHKGAAQTHQHMHSLIGNQM